MNDAAAIDIAKGERFAFGANWSRFLESLNQDRILSAEASLRDLLEVDTLDRVRLLDAGSGSGLFSLAARRLGAIVHSFDYDMRSVACTAELKRRYFRDDSSWTVGHGSVLDRAYLERLGQFDIVYSWGVLHHTGAMWQAMANVAERVAAGGLLVTAIYSDQGSTSRRWAAVKRMYNRHRWMRPVLLMYGLLQAWGVTTVRDFCRLTPFASWQAYHRERGMSPWCDVVDWIGGWPYEAATPQAVFRFCRCRGFSLQNLVTRQGYGCNEFVFVKRTSD